MHHGRCFVSHCLGSRGFVVLILHTFVFYVLRGPFCFRADMINSSNQNKNEVEIPQSATYWVLFIFFLPDVIHCIYLTQAPGYNLRGFHRQVPQVIYSLLAQFGVRPLYELCWSFKWMQIMNYVTLQNEGSVVTDSGISER